jgi:ribosomal protein S18 acetylase RimI-like enzyme
MRIETNNAAHFGEFIRLNELWISEHFSLEEGDRALAANPGKVVSDGGYIFSLLDGGQVVGVCALFKESPQRYQLARMAVEPAARGNGYGNRLIEHALAHAKTLGASSVFLLSNTVLQAAVALYRKHGFVTVSTGPHPEYARCNIVMERAV